MRLSEGDGNVHLAASPALSDRVAILQEPGALDGNHVSRRNAFGDLDTVTARTPACVMRRRSTMLLVLQHEYIAVAILHHHAGDGHQQCRVQRRPRWRHAQTCRGVRCRW